MAPSLQLHYTAFFTTTGHSVPVPRIGTLALVGSPLELLPWHRDDRFSSSEYEPEPNSRRLNAGRHAGSKQVSPALLPRASSFLGFDVAHMFRRFISGSLALVFSTLT
jgi:hypothetical protein